MDDWKAPDFVEIKMDAEIGSYQEDFEALVREDVAPAQADEAR